MSENPVPDIEPMESEALASITAVERFLFGRSIKRNVRNKKSRFYNLLPRYGVAGTTSVITGSLWLLPGFVLLVISVILEVVSKPGNPERVISYILFAFALGCGVMMIARSASGARMGSQFRSSRSSSL